MEFTIDAINQYIRGRFDDMKAHHTLPGWKYGYTESQMYYYANALVNLMFEHLSLMIPSFPRNGIWVTPPRLVGDMYQMTIQFDEDALWRDSLYQGEEKPTWNNYSVRDGKYGTDNIVKQFISGWHTGGQVHGMWHGKMTTSRRSRRGYNMLRAALSEWIDLYPWYGKSDTQAMRYAILLGDYNQY